MREFKDIRTMDDVPSFVADIMKWDMGLYDDSKVDWNSPRSVKYVAIGGATGTGVTAPKLTDRSQKIIDHFEVITTYTRLGRNGIKVGKVKKATLEEAS